MRTRTLLWLVFITALMVLAAGATVWQQRRSEAFIEPQPLVVGLEHQLNEITSVSIKQGDRSIIIDRSPQGWVIADRDQYPAKIEEVRRLLLQLTGLSRLEQKSSDAEFLGPLGFGPDALTQPLRIELSAASETFADFEVGVTTPDGLGRYVRLVADGSVWLIDGTLSADPTVPAWAETDLLRLGSDFLRSITTMQRDAPAFTVTRQGQGLDAEYTIDPMPDGREIGSPSQFAKLFGSVALLTFVDVRERTDDLPSPEATLTYTTSADSRFTISHWTEADDFGELVSWITLDFEGGQSQRKQLEQWAFQLTPYASGAFAMGIDDLTFELPEPIDDAAGPDPGLESGPQPAPE